MISFEPVSVQQENLRGFVADQTLGELFVIIKNVTCMFQIGIDEFLLQFGVATPASVLVNSAVHPVPGVHSDRRDPVTTVHEKSFRIASVLQIAAGVEIGMAEIAQ